MDKSKINTPRDQERDQTVAVRVARHVTWVGFWVNAVLGVMKVIGGILGRSSALIADGIHSFSDFLSDIIVIVMVGKARKHPDANHQFGHGHFEAVATLCLAIVLMVVAVGIIIDGVDGVLAVARGEVLPKPGTVALVILLLSIVAKEWLFHYTRRAGERIRSEAVIANAWHHRSDAFSSVATLLGVAGAMFLGERWRVLDPIAAIVVGIIIIAVSVSLGRKPLNEILGSSLPPSDCDKIRDAVASTPGVKGWHCMRTFRSGNDAYVEVHIKVDPEINVRQAHLIASKAESRVAAALDDYSAHVTTHIEPYEG